MKIINDTNNLSFCYKCTEISYFKIRFIYYEKCTYNFTNNESHSPPHNSVVSIFLAVPSIVEQYADANLVIICSNVLLLSEISSPYEFKSD